MSDTFDKESRKTWTREGQPSMEDLQVGCLQRIAAATELMAKDHDRLVRERASAIKSRDYWREQAERAFRRLSASKGQVTKLKRQLARATQPLPPQSEE